MKTAKEFINIFNSTRKLSLETYLEDTECMVEHTKYYVSPSETIKSFPWKGVENPTITFENKGTVNTAYELEPRYRCVGMLNFADALIPGGYVTFGANAQEENMNKCTNLYETLILNYNYYMENRLRVLDDPYMSADRIDNHNRMGVYTDGLLYSSSVSILRDDTTYEVVEPRKVDVVTCPAPFAPWLDNNTLEPIFIRRIEGVVKAFIANGCDCVVLGAWGCGAFGNDIDLVARCFAKVLKKYSRVDVVFAILGDATREIFESSFNDEYNKETK